MYLVKSILVIVLGFLLYKAFKNQMEGLQNENPLKTALAKQILNAFANDVSYSAYLDVLKQNKNSSYKLIEQDTYYELKLYFKNKNLSLAKIYEFMSDMK